MRLEVIKRKKIDRSKLMEKLGKWKYSLYELSQKIFDELLEALKPRWDSAMKISKGIYGKTLRQFMLSLNEKEVKKSLN